MTFVPDDLARFIDLGVTRPFADVLPTFLSTASELSGRSQASIHFDLMNRRDGLRVVS